MVKPAAVAAEWSVAVTDEFFAQGDMERALAIEASGPPCVRRARAARRHRRARAVPTAALARFLGGHLFHRGARARLLRFRERLDSK